ncbi:MAG TPA: NHL repeat-containing protein [Kofleriaceae bacterium]
MPVDALVDRSARRDSGGIGGFVIYVADARNDTIRKITAAGVVTTFAGVAGDPGSADGTGAGARLSDPDGVAVDGAGTVYVADTFNSTIRKITAAGAVTTLAGAAGFTGTDDGTGAAARFNLPEAVAVDGAGNVYVADTQNFTIRKITADGVVTTLAGVAGVAGSADGTGAEAQFGNPTGLAVDGAGNVYVADRDNATIRKVTPAGVAVDGAGNVFVADLGNFVIRKVTPAGVVTTFAGTAGMRGSVDGTGPAARFEVVTDLAIDDAGNLYVADFGANVIRKITSAGVVTTLAGTADTSGSADGTGAAARFNRPTGVAVDPAGNVYVTDTQNHTLRKITPAGVVTTVAGTAGVAGIVLGATPGLAFPEYLAIVGDSIVCTDNRAVLRLRHGAR